MPKFFINDIIDEIAVIRDDNYKHITKVLRLKEGDGIILSDNSGFDYDATIKEISNEEIIAFINKKYENKAEPKFDITLFQGYQKGDKFDFIFEKSVEAGVSTIIPVIMDRCVVKLKNSDFIKKQQRLQKISESAAKQSNRGKIPQVMGLHTIKDVLELKNSFDLLIFAYEEEKDSTLKSCISKFHGKKIGVIIGPEGGFSKEEADLLKSGGFKSATLGNRILRCETAGIATIFNILYDLEQ